ncbi:phage tail family protein [Streptomyces sp. SCSIO ZS0520]|uniref:phage tail family protein n=1 Tax=Streptomyces sp. SCSIO ZS0520 TaxID=2892996 RepID=UPI0021D7E633|nr:phage tail family protein [Streptomyces sp. SCSIO ZS0520]
MSYVAGQDLGGLRADLGALPLGSVDSAGVAWRLQVLEGWDGAEVRTDMQPREADHGAWAAPGYLGERPITLGGLIEAPDRPALEEAMDRMRAEVGLADTVLTVWESTPKQCLVRQSGRLVMQYQSDRIATYSVLVTAPDPRRYGTVLRQASTALPVSTGGLAPPVTPPVTITATTVVGSLDAANEGSFETRPVFVIDGPVDSPQILAQMPDGSVRFLTYSQSLATGDRLVLDTDAKSVILNGNASRRRFLSTPTGWPVIPAGSSVGVLFRAAFYNSGALLTVQWRPAWK